MRNEKKKKKWDSLALYLWDKDKRQWHHPSKNSTWPYLYEIPAHFIHEIKKIGYDVIGVNVFLRKLMKFLRKKEAYTTHSAWHQKRNAVSLKKGRSSWFSAVYAFQVLEDMFMHTYASSRVKRKSFYRKSELQTFLLISGGHIGAPKRCTNMASPYKALQRCMKRFGQKDLKLGQIV